MTEHQLDTPDSDLGQKKFGIYVIGFILCILLTGMSFWTVMASQWRKGEMFSVIYSLAIIQFLVQLICFIQLNTKTKHNRHNVMSMIFTIVILTSIILGSLWIMNNLNYSMMH